MTQVSCWLVQTCVGILQVLWRLCRQPLLAGKSGNYPICRVLLVRVTTQNLSTTPQHPC